MRVFFCTRFDNTFDNIDNKKRTQSYTIKHFQNAEKPGD